VSQAKQNPGYVSQDYLQMLAERVQHVKQRSYEAMEVREGMCVLDVGCGPAIDTHALAKLVGPSGRVYGVDYDNEMISNATKKTEEHALASYVEHLVADATKLPFDDNTFDACRSERVLQHVAHPEDVLAEMARVTKPGGRIVVVDTDFGTLSIDSSEDRVERILTRITTEISHYNGYAGRQLYRYFREQGLMHLQIEMLPFFVTQLQLMRKIFMLEKVEEMAIQNEAITQDELARWHASLEAAEAKQTLFGSASQVMLTGLVPG
tara:strand:+ start:5860 stop:6654 length:795 start_codon:yes stop_codon:yes gene_type:complete